MNENLNINNMWAQLPPEMQAQMMQMMMSMMQQAAEPEMKKKKITTPEGVEIEVYDTGSYYEHFNEGDIRCVTKQEQFYDEKMYTTLYNLTCGDIRRNNVIALLESKAKELGGTALAQHFKKNCVAAKKEAKEKKKREEEQAREARAAQEQAERDRELEEGRMTEYSNLPEGVQNMYIGEGWIATDDGVIKFEDNGKTVKRVEACMYPILASKLYRPLDNAASGATRRVEVYFGSEEGWQKATVEREVISNANKIISLSNMGAGVTSDNARQCVNFMASMMKESSKRGTLRIVNTLNKLGWDKDFKNFLPYTTDDYVFERQDELPDMMAALSEQGNSAEWYEKFKEIRALNYMPFKLATAALLASVILPMLPKQDSFIANLYGGSGYGKSAMLSIVCTIFSNMDNKSGGIFLDSDNTQTSLELTCDTFNNFPVILDDVSKGDQDKKRKFQEAVMMIANGRGKNRATKDLKQRKRYTFSLTALVSSEQVITKDYTTNGSIYRVLPKQVEEYFPYLDKKKYPNLENIEDLIWFFQNNYGHCGRDFVEQVKKLGQQKIMERNKKNLKKARKLAKENGREGRQARHHDGQRYLG